MAHRPRVAISQRVEIVASHGEVRDCLDQEWTTWIESLGASMIPVPNRIGDVSAFCDEFGIDALFLSGGNNFSTHVYEDPSVQVTDGSAERDATERAMVDHAIATGTPLVAWCRGMQVLQVHFGGRLCRTDSASVGHVATTHPIDIVSPEHQGLLGKRVTVNSFHDFGVRRDALAPPLRELGVVADPDLELVEAVYHPELPIVGCQWHPERANGGDEFNRALVKRLVFPEDQS